MKCLKCGWKPKARNVGLLGMHMELAHKVPRSVVLNVLRRMGYEKVVESLEIPTIIIPKQSTKTFEELLRKELERKDSDVG